MPKFIIIPIAEITERKSPKHKKSMRYRFHLKPTRYSGEMLRKLRAERGVGNVRKIRKEA